LRCHQLPFSRLSTTSAFPVPSPTQVTLFGLSRYYALVWVVIVLLFGVLAYFMEVRGTSRKPAELRYMAKEYAFSCLGFAFFVLWFLLWRVFVESHYVPSEDAFNSTQNRPLTHWPRCTSSPPPRDSIQIMINLVVSILKLLGSVLWLDAILFWLHYMMHMKSPINIYALSHGFHHKLREPSGFAFHAIDPIESMIILFGMKCIQFILPIEPCYLDFLNIVQTLVNFMGHLTDVGDEKISSFSVMNSGSSFWSLFTNSNGHHRLHHLYPNCNYSILAFTYWDRLIGTDKSPKNKQRKAITVCVTKENERVSSHITMCCSSDAVQNSVELPIKDKVE